MTQAFAKRSWTRWPPERIALLRRFWAQRPVLSRQEIAARLGCRPHDVSVLASRIGLTNHANRRGAGDPKARWTIALRRALQERGDWMTKKELRAAVRWPTPLSAMKTRLARWEQRGMVEVDRSGGRMHYRYKWKSEQIALPRHPSTPTQGVAE